MKRVAAVRRGATLAVLCCAGSAHAGRPLTTDDAGVVGERTFQIESWLLADAALLEHATSVAFGPTEWLELAVAGAQGFAHEEAHPTYALRAPIVQAKALAREPGGFPGVAFGGGSVTPLGVGYLELPGWNFYGYVAASQPIGDEVLAFHANLGAAALSGARGAATWLAGLAVSAPLLGDLSGFLEIYRGDVYDARVHTAFGQLGLLFAVSDVLQIDGTVASSIPGLTDGGGTTEWLTVGAKVVGGPL